MFDDPGFMVLKIDTIKDFFYSLGLMNNKHRKTLKAVFDDPVSSSILWSDIEKLFVGLGCRITEGRGSRVRVVKNDVFAVFHRLHPAKEANKGAVVSARDYLTKIGATL